MKFSPLAERWKVEQPTPLARAVQERRRRNLPLLDLITANPQEHGFAFDPKLLESILAHAREATQLYRPDPRGHYEARAAVAAYHGNVDADHVLLTPGTSLAYYFAFRLLAQPGDDILCPSPTYPLFEDLARLAGLRVRYYHLEQVAGSSHWSIHLDELEFQMTSRTRAIVVVSPHNPTGSIASPAELEGIARIAARKGTAIIFDEVFRECVHTEKPMVRPSVFHPPLTITLNGLSKMLSLTGLKAGWMVVEGEPAICSSFLSAAEYLCDLFLPVSEITQSAIPMLLQQSVMRQSIASLYRSRMLLYLQAWKEVGLPELQLPEGSPYLCIPLPALHPDGEEPLVVDLLKHGGALTHGGELYRMPSPHLVTTCVHQPPWNLVELLPLTGTQRAASK